MDEARVELLWLPLGAGGPAAVRAGGWTYEHWAARRDGREPVRLFHSALRVTRGATAYVVEVAPEWSQPGVDRGVVAGGAVGSRLLGVSRWFRYEVRAWPGGVLPDEQYAVGTAALATDAVAHAVASWPPCPTCRPRSGAATSWASARCGTPTPWWRGWCW